MKLQRAAKTLEQGSRETLSYYDFPAAHWRKIRTNNALERLNREIRKRTNVVGSFPDSKAALDACSGKTSIRIRSLMGHEAVHEYRVPGTGMEPLLEREIESAIQDETHTVDKLQHDRFSRCSCLNSNFAKNS